jgi:hypothetical protein
MWVSESRIILLLLFFVLALVLLTCIWYCQRNLTRDCAAHFTCLYVTLLFCHIFTEALGKLIVFSRISAVTHTLDVPVLLSIVSIYNRAR